VTFSNIGGAPLLVTGVTLPSAPFSATGLPLAGAVLNPGDAVTVTLAFAPTVVGNFTGDLILGTTAGQADVPLSGSARTPGILQVDPVALDFGTLEAGQTGSQTFRVWNSGGSRVTVTKSKPPAAGVGFTATADLPEGQTFNPGDSLTLGVTFSPLVGGAATDHWIINSDGSVGVVTVNLTGVGDVPVPHPPPPGDAGVPTDGGTPDPSPPFPGGGCDASGGGAFTALLGVVPWLLRRRRAASGSGHHVAVIEQHDLTLW
jgi:iron transport multicopper oxidase